MHYLSECTPASQTPSSDTQGHWVGAGGNKSRKTHRAFLQPHLTAAPESPRMAKIHNSKTKYAKSFLLLFEVDFHKITRRKENSNTTRKSCTTSHWSTVTVIPKVTVPLRPFTFEFSRLKGMLLLWLKNVCKVLKTSGTLLGILRYYKSKYTKTNSLRHTDISQRQDIREQEHVTRQICFSLGRFFIFLLNDCSC